MRVHGVSTHTIKDLLPVHNPWMVNRPRKGETPAQKMVEHLLQDVHQIQMHWVSLQMAGVGDTIQNQNDYGAYLEFPNTHLQNLAFRIVIPADTNDEKAFKIMRWVQDNIQYVSDIENYGQPEYWAGPSLTVQKKSGDCEDGAFLMQSLMLNGGIPWERIRTYGGLVASGPGADGGGHAWTAYKRETDDAWIVLDWCYYPDPETPLDERTPMKDDLKYWDDYFYVDAMKTVETPLANYVRNPPAIGVKVFTGFVWKYRVGQRLDIMA
jgi:predicted transglutaminase-like cysteine proteinase